MIQFFKKNIESNKKLRTFEIIVLCLLIFTSIGSVFYGLMQIHKDVGDLQYVQSVTMDRDKDEVEIQFISNEHQSVVISQFKAK